MSEVLRKNVLKTLNKCIGKYIYINEDKILLKSVSWVDRCHFKINDMEILVGDICFEFGAVYLLELSRREDETYFKEIENETIIKYREVE